MAENKLPLSYYESFDTLTLAQKLLGCELVHDSPDGITSGIIVETEAYLANDPACHAYNRRTVRTEPMYGLPGTIYVYLIYGMYQCVNVVSNRVGIGEAVLIRALQPTSGIELMQLRRHEKRKITYKEIKDISLTELCRGPGKLVQAMGIERELHNNHSFSDSSLYITPPLINDIAITASKRIGIRVGMDLQYRFTIQGSKFISK
ncbi:DNA-3-methyladenine glycosylase [Dyadobacter sp. NIV53]|uniref:DNA-3-methyladenine glycosylase n=1 Tax=Dyadobacter sp. NIV53 TaxID=2861765 RepID=UPI001C88A32E|nr:DNA-3-methyladenine glycosylase [Dyadobacter sp. NIV53]